MKSETHTQRRSTQITSIQEPSRSPWAWTRAFRLPVMAVAAMAMVIAPLHAQTVELGTAEAFAVLGGSAVTNTGATIVVGDLGISPNEASSVTGFPPGVIVGTTHFGDAVALQAQNDVTTAYNTLAGRACDETISGDLGGRTLAPGVYCSASSMALTGTLTLDAQNDPDAVFIFQTGTTMITASNSSVELINAAQSCSVFWQVGSSATLGTGSDFVGNILALSSITLTTGASTSGRVLARNGAVTLDASTVSLCAVAGPKQPTISKAFSPSSIQAAGLSTLTITLSNPSDQMATLTAAMIDTLPIGVVVAAQTNVATTCGGAGTPMAQPGGTSVTLPAGQTIPVQGSCTLTVDVTAALAGIYVNIIPAGALITSNGDNPAPAVATLTVLAGVASTPAVPIPTLSNWTLLVLATLMLAMGAYGARRGF